MVGTTSAAVLGTLTMTEEVAGIDFEGSDTFKVIDMGKRGNKK